MRRKRGLHIKKDYSLSILFGALIFVLFVLPSINTNFLSGTFSLNELGIIEEEIQPNAVTIGPTPPIKLQPSPETSISNYIKERYPHIKTNLYSSQSADKLIFETNAVKVTFLNIGSDVIDQLRDYKQTRESDILISKLSDSHRFVWFDIPFITDKPATVTFTRMQDFGNKDAYTISKFETEEQRDSYFATANGAYYATVPRNADNTITFTVDSFSGYGTGGGSPPTHDPPSLTSTSGFDVTEDDLTCIPQNTVDPDGDDFVNVYVLNKNNVPLPIAYLPFDISVSTSKDAVHDYASNNHATLGDGNPTKSPTWVGTGKSLSGGAYKFDGFNDYMTIDHHPSIDFDTTDDFTLSFWMRTDSIDNVEILLHKGLTISSLPYPPSLLLLGLEPTRGVIGFLVSDGVTSMAQAGTTPLDDNLWHHIVFLKKGNDFILYLDGGVETSLTAALTNPTTNGYELVIGTSRERSSVFYDGYLDEFRIYPFALSAEQIQLQANKRYNVVSHQETLPGEDWTCTVTPTDGTSYGISKTSNVITVIDNAAPIQDKPDFISVGATPTSDDNLICAPNNIYDPNSDFVSSFYQFIVNGNPYSSVYYPFERDVDNPSLLYDYSPGNSDGTLYGPTYIYPYVFGGGISFDGINDYITSPDTLSLDFDVNTTIEFFFEITSYNFGSTILAKSGLNGGVQEVNYGVDIQQNPSTGKAEIGYYYTDYVGTFNHYTTTSANLNLNSFYHVVIQKSEFFSPLIYIDGVLQTGNCDVGACFEDPAPNNYALTFGQNPSLPSPLFFAGKLDEFMMYLSVVGEGQILKHSSGRYSEIDSDETTEDDVWGCRVLLHDGEEQGESEDSDTLTILAGSDDNDNSGGSSDDDDDTGGGGESSSQTYTYSIHDGSATYNLFPEDIIKIVDFGTTMYTLTLVKTSYPDYGIFHLVPTVGTLKFKDGVIKEINLDAQNTAEIKLSFTTLGTNNVNLNIETIGSPVPQDSPLPPNPPPLPNDWLDDFSLPDVIPTTEGPSQQNPLDQGIQKLEPNEVLEIDTFFSPTFLVIVLAIFILVTLFVVVKKLKTESPPSTY